MQTKHGISAKYVVKNSMLNKPCVRDQPCDLDELCMSDKNVSCDEGDDDSNHSSPVLSQPYIFPVILKPCLSALLHRPQKQLALPLFRVTGVGTVRACLK
ncbi:hypothetical protein Pcinc_020375 [Petrolisthes cinctipes]|uniref:Uncharacterized protein n=1 Tax=Petrolisthes cinctipes TaxID=88211 RepID=A0AAE1KJV1_PETCI|nr:hypothetical protein Pcinc_020375 [Petrolisthes cinctipes]